MLSAKEKCILNPKWFGDSYDIVKKFFVDILKNSGYEVYMDPMFTGSWGGEKQNFIKFVGAKFVDEFKNTNEKSALFIDPDTGIGKKSSSKHVTVNSISRKLEKYEIVFSFDQSFSYGKSPKEQMQEKLSELILQGGTGFYYDSHARFLFASKNMSTINEIKETLLEIGLPSTRLYIKKGA